LSRSMAYERIKRGELKTQKDGSKTFITYKELERYIDLPELPRVYGFNPPKNRQKKAAQS